MKKKRMKAVLVMLCICAIAACQNYVDVRKPLRIIYGGDTLIISLQGDSAIFAGSAQEIILRDSTLLEIIQAHSSVGGAATTVEAEYDPDADSLLTVFKRGSQYFIGFTTSITGSGTGVVDTAGGQNTQMVPYWTDKNTLGGELAFLYNPANNTVTAGIFAANGNYWGHISTGTETAGAFIQASYSNSDWGIVVEGDDVGNVGAIKGIGLLGDTWGIGWGVCSHQIPNSIIFQTTNFEANYKEYETPTYTYWTFYRTILVGSKGASKLQCSRLFC